ncbi:DUF2811 domain-containing protein [Spirulina major CS-329]|jgi:hypothetical protein|uniref:DUF2811 domain-containing protein n=1 Tax=Spirulina TaxID=1154 RepID=UPI0009320FF2|nr:MULTISPECIES: DUF2811 domain-containing protein [Spirulina]MDB9494351.1 DUF2811 domain-containing protein [Spirulina subsalsa CS-330]MDB9502341.1 DUF2811 domain-containing protein [Spirulina major CS-329]
MTTQISILTEIPEDLHQSLRNYLDQHPTWDQDQVMTAALSFFLLFSQSQRPLQSTQSLDPACAKAYLETLFHT